MAHKLGIPRWINLNTGPAVTLGVNPVSPLWMTSAYATLANNGIRHAPDPIETVSSIETGKTLEKDSHRGKRVIPDGVAYEADSVLAQTVNGTASKTPLYHGVQGGKTGTTNDHKDAWFCGFTPTLAACVWLGYPKGEIPMTSLPVYGEAFGGDYPAIDLDAVHERGVRRPAGQVPAGRRVAAAPEPGAVEAVHLAVPHLHPNVRPRPGVDALGTVQHARRAGPDQR